MGKPRQPLGIVPESARNAGFDSSVDRYVRFPDQSKAHLGAFSCGARIATGTEKWFNDAKGNCVITPDDGSDDVFAHFSAISMVGFKALREGQKVQFEVTKWQKGKQASNIQAS